MKEESVETEEIQAVEQSEEIAEEEPQEIEIEEPELEESENSSDSEVTGTIYLSGEEAMAVGDSLVVAHIAIGIAGNERIVVLTDKNTPIGDEGPMPEDVQNNFVIVGLYLGDKATIDADKGLSINISMMV